MDSSDDPRDVVELKREGQTAIITINRPRSKNAVNESIALGIEEAIDNIEGDDDLWTAIIFGAGGVFSTGADLKALASGIGSAIFTKRGGFAGITKRERQKPLIAAVDGMAWAGGLEIVLSCDLVVASERSSFALPEVKRSLLAGAGGLFRLPRSLPINLATYMALTGEPISDASCEPARTCHPPV